MFLHQSQDSFQAAHFVILSRLPLRYAFWMFPPLSLGSSLSPLREILFNITVGGVNYTQGSGQSVCCKERPSVMSVEIQPCGSAQTKTFLKKILSAKDPYMYDVIKQNKNACINTYINKTHTYMTHIWHVCDIYS